jgi:hypothetical protein
MIHSFTVTFGTQYLTGMVTSVPPSETFSLIKNNILHQSKNYKISLRKFKFLRYMYVIFMSRWSCDIHIHKYAGILIISSVHKFCR